MKIHLRISRKFLTIFLSLLIFVNLGILAWAGYPFYLQKVGNTQPQSSPSLVSTTPNPSQTSTTSSLSTVPVESKPQSTVKPVIRQPDNGNNDLVVLSMSDGLNIHLFAYHPQYLPLTRLTRSPFDDIHPSINPDGTKIAFSSRRNGFWDLYILDLLTQKISRVTDTPEYDGSPSWSPDGQWLVFESYTQNNLDLYLKSLQDLTQPAIRLTDSPAAEYAPSWSPKGREIAYTSNISGEDHVYIAYLDRTTDRVVRVNQASSGQEAYPRWSPDSSRLSWIQKGSSGNSLMVWDIGTSDLLPRPVTYADKAVWMGDSSSLFIEVNEPNRSTFGGFTVDPGYVNFPLVALPGSLHGYDSKKGIDIRLIQPFVSTDSQKSAAPVWQPQLSVYPVVPANRFPIVPLKDVTAPYPMLLDTVDESFIKLRDKVAIEAGWDALSSLENAFIPLTISPNPSIDTDWFYTGRAWSLNPLYMSAGWVVISRENYSGQTYWRLYLKARFQDGSMGIPLRVPTWDLNARFSGDPHAYEEGGLYGSIPAGYWIDLTELASRYSWERLPALINWRTFFPSIRYNQFVIKGSLDWMTAMTEIYPPEALSLPTRTPLPTPYPTRTPTPSNYSPPGPTRTPTITNTPTTNPTWTPIPGSP